MHYKQKAAAGSVRAEVFTMWYGLKFSALFLFFGYNIFGCNFKMFNAK